MCLQLFGFPRLLKPSICRENRARGPVHAPTSCGTPVFDPERHLPPHAQSPARDDAKKRIGYFLDMVASGERFYHVRRLVRATWDQAQAVKHRAEPNRTDAGVATDAAVLLASILRRLVTEVDECDQSTKRSGV